MLTQYERQWAFEVVPERQSCTVVQTVSREMRSSAWDDSHRRASETQEKGLIVVLEVETLGKSRPRDFFPRDGGRLSGSSSAFRPVKSQPAQALSRSSPCWWLVSAARGGVAYVFLENRARGSCEDQSPGRDLWKQAPTGPRVTPSVQVAKSIQERNLDPQEGAFVGS